MPSAKKSTKAIEALRERLGSSSTLFPIPALLAGATVLILSGHLLMNLNFRTGNPASPTQLEGEASPDSSIWFSVSHKNGELYVISSDRDVFSWKTSNLLKQEDLEPFREHLKQVKINKSLDAALAKRINLAQTIVVLSVDESLLYEHVRPILYVLAELGYTHYAFETKKPFS